MDFSPVELSDDDAAFQRDLRAFLAEIVTDEVIERDRVTGENFDEAVHLALGVAGYLAADYRSEDDGGFTPVRRRIWQLELGRSRAPWFHSGTTFMAARTVEAFADPDLREQVLPGVLTGEIRICLGYTEPEGGSDVATCKTRAVRDGDDWVINGQKMWTSLAHFCDYTWLAVRTDSDAPKKHQGISMFLVPNSDPGWSCTPVHTLGGVRTNATYYDNIRVSDDHLVGELNGGWKLITGQLNRERLSLINFGPISQLFNQVTRWARETELPAGGRVVDQPWVQQNLGRCRALIECMKLIVYKQSWAMTVGALEMADASAAKVYGSEGFIEISCWGRW